MVKNENVSYFSAGVFVMLVSSVWKNTCQHSSKYWTPTQHNQWKRIRNLYVYFSPFNCCFVAWKWTYPENWHVVYCHIKERSFLNLRVWIFFSVSFTMIAVTWTKLVVSITINTTKTFCHIHVRSVWDYSGLKPGRPTTDSVAFRSDTAELKLARPVWIRMTDDPPESVNWSWPQAGLSRKKHKSGRRPVRSVVTQTDSTFSQRSLLITAAVLNQCDSQYTSPETLHLLQPFLD